jgi:hypothetical protein
MRPLYLFPRPVQIVLALKKMHDVGVIHRDIKPANILVNGNCDLVVCDFGLARGVDAEFSADLTQNVITRWYRPPELLCESKEYGMPADIWSAGCLFAEFLLRGPPIFPGSTIPHQLAMIGGRVEVPSLLELRASGYANARALSFIGRNSQEPRSWPETSQPANTAAARELLAEMLRVNQWERITATDALNHRYFQNMANELGADVWMPRFNWDIEREYPAGMPREVLQHYMLDLMQQVHARNFIRDPAVLASDMVTALEREIAIAHAQPVDETNVASVSRYYLYANSAQAALASFGGHLLRFLSQNPHIKERNVNVGGMGAYTQEHILTYGMMDMVNEATVYRERASAMQIPQCGVPQRSVSMGGMPQRGVPQRSVSMGGMPQYGVSQRGVLMDDMLQRGIPQRSISQRSVPMDDMPQCSAPQRSAPQRSVSQRSVSQRSVSQRSVSQRSVSQRRVFQRRVSQRRVPQRGVSRQSMPESDMDENYTSSDDGL